MKELSILGAGAYGEVIKELAEDNKYRVLGFYDDTMEEGNEVYGLKVLGSIKQLLEENSIKGEYAVSIGDIGFRTKCFKRIRGIGGRTPYLIHSKAIVSPSASIGEGSYIQAGASIWTGAKIGTDCVVAPMASVSHHTTLGDGSFISPGATVGSRILLEKNVFIGMGAVVMSGVKVVGENTVVGAGSLVIRDVGRNKVVYGSPAKEKKSI